MTEIWYIYMIENRLGQLYTGISKDYNRRFAEHAQNKKKCAKALKGKGPLALKFCASLKSHSDALKAEVWVKKLAKQHKLKLIEGTLSLPNATLINLNLAES